VHGLGGDDREFGDNFAARAAGRTSGGGDDLVTGGSGNDALAGGPRHDNCAGLSGHDSAAQCEFQSSIEQRLHDP
jgi:hypothetical protein